MKPLRFLATSDIHLGRRSTHVGTDANSEFTATRMVWQDLIQLAIDRKVDALLLAGDIVDQANRYYEAWGPLEAGVRRLAEKGIRTFAVAGNHDYDVFPRLMDDLGNEAFTLLGRDGQWSLERFTPEDRPVCQLIGWSFPSSHYRENPLDSFDLSIDTTHPCIALLHTQLDDLSGPYAGVATRTLGGRGVGLWVLGHVHQHSSNDVDGTRVMYCGSLQAMDPGESGEHGAWLVTVDPAGTLSTELLPLSRVRYENCEIDITGASTPEDVEGWIPRSIGEFVDRIAEGEEGRLRYLSLRARVTGRVPRGLDAAPVAEKAQADLDLVRGQIRVVLDAVTVNTIPEVDLDALVESSGLAGELARLIRALEQEEPDEGAMGLVREALEEIASWTSAVQDLVPKVEEDQVRSELLVEARRLLDTLLAGREAE